MDGWQVSALPLTQPRKPIDSYRFPGAWGFDEPEDYLLPAPDPRQRLPFALPAEDRRRLDLHAVLTTAGIAPMPGDAKAIAVLSALDDATVSAVLRWVDSAQT
ncbi:hypothetical protein AB0M39_30115 [Streptomyces sp. NPDC051907]|uniref:hypothetical protein n=1 Tax=Streptomyces sp. NPDC051907 TaxID=3155284 RepID=UPI0034161EC5